MSTPPFGSTKDASCVRSSVLEMELGKTTTATARMVHALALRAQGGRDFFFRLQDDAGVRINTVAIEIICDGDAHRGALRRRKM